jgi:nucleoside-diphosphate-sugar epimerase
MKLVIPGGAGQVGTILARAFHADGHEVVVLSRQPKVQSWRVVAWDGVTLGRWRDEVDGYEYPLWPDAARSVRASDRDGTFDNAAVNFIIQSKL